MSIRPLLSGMVLVAWLLAACQSEDELDAARDSTPQAVATPAAAPASGADSGERSYAACAACHGPQGEGNPALDAPAIGGLDATYIARQIRYFRDGLRGADPADHVGRPMHLVALNHPVEGQIDELASFIAAMPGILEPRDPSAAPDDPGARVYAACAACHGSRAEGNPALNSPALGGQHRTYLLRQLAAFKSGRRGAEEDDLYGRQMAAAVAGLSDEELKDVATFLASPEG